MGGHLREALNAQVPGLRIDYVDLDWATQHRAVLDHTVDAAIVWYAGPEAVLRYEGVLSSTRVAVVPARFLLAAAASLPMDDVADGPWLATSRLSPLMRKCLGPAVGPGPNAPVVHQPAAITTAVAIRGYIALHAEVARDFYPRDDVRFVPFEGEAVQIAVVTRADDERPIIAALRRAAHFARAGVVLLPSAADNGSRRNPGGHRRSPR